MWVADTGQWSLRAPASQRTVPVPVQAAAELPGAHASVTVAQQPLEQPPGAQPMAAARAAYLQQRMKAMASRA